MLALYKAQVISLHWKRDNSYIEFMTCGFDSSSETAERNSTKLNRKQDLNVLYRLCVFRAVQVNKVDASTSDWLKFFWLLFRNRLTKFKLTCQVARSQRPLPFFFLFFGPIRKTRWTPRPLIGWDIFNFSSETIEWNSMNLDRKQDPKVLFQDCVFRADQ